MSTSNVIFVALCLLLACVAVNAQSTWKYSTPLLTPRSYAGVSVLGNNIYIIAGTNNDTFTPTVQKLNPSTNAWTSVANVKSLRYGLAAATAGNTIYAFGGYNPLSVPLKVVEAYNPDTDSWSTVAPMNTARFNLGGVSVNGIIYAIGGLTQQAALSSVETYSPSTNKWTALSASMKVARYGLGVAVLNNIIYAVGGSSYSHSGSASLKTVEGYNLNTKAWTTLASLQEARYCPGVVVFQNKIYAFGGLGGQANLNTTEIYDPTTNKWTYSATMPDAVYASAGVAYNQIVYAMGGVENTGYASASVQILQ